MPLYYIRILGRYTFNLSRTLENLEKYESVEKSGIYWIRKKSNRYWVEIFVIQIFIVNSNRKIPSIFFFFYTINLFHNFIVIYRCKIIERVFRARNECARFLYKNFCVQKYRISIKKKKRYKLMQYNPGIITIYRTKDPVALRRWTKVVRGWWNPWFNANNVDRRKRSGSGPNICEKEGKWSTCSFYGRIRTGTISHRLII